MSRHNFSSNDFTVVLGVDHVTSVFIQVYERNPPMKKLIFSANNKGIASYSGKTMTQEQRGACDKLKNAMDYAVKSGISYPNISDEYLSSVAQAFGVNIPLTKIYQILD